MLIENCLTGTHQFLQGKVQKVGWGCRMESFGQGSMNVYGPVDYFIAFPRGAASYGQIYSFGSVFQHDSIGGEKREPTYSPSSGVNQ